MEKLKTEEIKEFARKGFSIMQINEQGYKEVIRVIQNALDLLDTNIKSYYLEDVFDNYFVYRITGQDNLTKYFKRNYMIQTDETVEFTGEPVQVKKDVTYMNINNNYKRTKGVTNMGEKVDKPCCPEKVDALILNEASNFTEDDKEWLSEQDEGTINKLIPKEVEVKKEEKEVPEDNKEEIINDLKKSFKTPEDFIAFMPEGMQDQMKSGLALHNKHRDGLQKTILDNTESTWEEKELKTMSTKMLEKIAGSVSPVTDYSANGNNRIFAEDEQEGLLPVGVNIEKKTE